MSGWGEVVAALPKAVASDSNNVEVQAPAVSEPTRAQAHGWVEKNAYNYDVYTKSSKEIDEGKADFQANGVEVGDWAGNAEVYKWDDEYGDVGPAFPALERQLFGGETMKRGIDFGK